MTFLSLDGRVALVTGATGMAPYGSSLAAVNLLTKSWAAEYGPHGVRVNTVGVGPTRTEGTEGTAPMSENLDALAAEGPLGRPAPPQEQAVRRMTEAFDS